MRKGIGLSLLIAAICFSFNPPSKVKLPAGCDYAGTSKTRESYLYEAFDEDADGVRAIVNAVGLSQNFVVLQGDVPNATATVLWNEKYKAYDRVIVVNAIWLIGLREKYGKWAALTVLAHEIGHHLGGHTINNGNDKLKEREADRFAAFTLAKMGATDDEALLAINSLSADDPTDGIHWPKYHRWLFTREAWQNAHGRNGIPNDGKKYVP